MPTITWQYETFSSWNDIPKSYAYPDIQNNLEYNKNSVRSSKREKNTPLTLLANLRFNSSEIAWSMSSLNLSAGTRTVCLKCARTNILMVNASENHSMLKTFRTTSFTQYIHFMLSRARRKAWTHCNVNLRRIVCTGNQKCHLSAVYRMQWLIELVNLPVEVYMIVLAQVYTSDKHQIYKIKIACISAFIEQVGSTSCTNNTSI